MITVVRKIPLTFRMFARWIAAVYLIRGALMCAATDSVLLQTLCLLLLLLAVVLISDATVLLVTLSIGRGEKVRRERQRQHDHVRNAATTRTHQADSNGKPVKGFTLFQNYDPDRKDN